TRISGEVKALVLSRSGLGRSRTRSTWRCRTAICKGGRLKAEVAKLVPWLIEAFRGATTSVCKGRWVEIRHSLKLCYAQWEDVGPFRTDGSGYVFGSCPPQPNANRGAGIDVSPAV